VTRHELGTVTRYYSS